MKNRESGFELLRNYLSSLGEKDILEKIDKKPYIDMTWVFTEAFDRTVIQKAISNFMKKANNRYEKNTQHIGRKPEDILGFKVFNNEDRMVLQAQGADGWTKINITNNKKTNDNIGILTITIEDLENEILNVLNNEKIADILSELDLDEEDKEQLSTIFKEKGFGHSKVTLMGVEEALNKAWINLADYYEYLLETRKEHTTSTCTIKQRADEGIAKRTYSKTGKTVQRLNELIPFTDRAKVLEDMNPSNIVEVNEINDDGDIIKNSYTVYAYDDCLQGIGQTQKGKAFICEPLEGNRSTRLMYLSRKDIDEFPIENGEDKYTKIVEKYLSMSQHEFSEQEGTAKISHTDPATYKERIEFYLQGRKSKSINSLKEYIKKLQGLYNNPDIKLPYYRGRDIAKIVNEVPESLIDRTAQKYAERELVGKEAKE